jgi:glutamine synthetase
MGTSDLVLAADAMMSAKFMVRSAAKRGGHLATFLPKPVEGLRGSGMPLHFSLWKGEETLFGGQGYGGLSEIAMLSIGGILHHAPALTALCNPTTNSYRRLHYSIDNPFHLGYAQQSRRAACCIPSFSSDPRAKCVEIRTPDASANPYLAFAAILMAAIDGIQNKIEAGTPMLADAEEKPPKRPLPSSLWDALDCLEQDTEFLTKGDVFPQEMLERWLSYKRDVEQPAVESHPTPAEYQRYLDC